MRPVFLLLSIVLLACGGHLTEEQKQQMHKNMEEHKIVRVTEVEIMEAAYAEGRRITHMLDSLAADSTALDAFLNKQGEKVQFITPGTANVRPLEKQLLDAYLADSSGSFEDNVQELRTRGTNYDSLLYTMPVADAANRLKGVWNIWLAKKELVIQIGMTK